MLQSAKRSRERRKEVYRKLFEKFQEHTQQIAALEERVDSLVAILQAAGITVPPELAGQVRSTVGARSGSSSSEHRETCQGAPLSGSARQDIASSIREIGRGHTIFGPDSPDNDELFEEMMRILGSDVDAGSR